MPHSRRRNQSPMTNILDSLSSDLGLVSIIALVLITVYLIDTITPLGDPVWLLYFIPLILSYWSDRSFAIPTVCSVTLIFLVGGLLVSPQGVPVSQALVYRFTFFVGFIGLSLVLFAIRRQQIIDDNLTR